MLRNRLLAFVLLAAFGAASCSSGSSSEGQASGTPVDADVRREMADLADRPSIDLRAVELPPAPPGYTDADVSTFADQAIDVAIGSFDPALSRLDPDAAVEKVLEDQYEDTKDDYLSRLAGATFGYPNQWVVASRFKKPPRPVEFIRVAWDAKVVKGTLDGVPGKYLSLTLQVHGKQNAVDAPGSPIVVRRTITLSGWKPRGGPEWWPSLTVAATTYGNDGCVLLDKPELSVQGDTAMLRSDVALLRQSLRGNRVMPETSTSQTSYDDFARECRAGAKP